MRIAVVSDIHDNLTAFEAVLADLRDVSPDLILHGGDLANGGSSPAEIVDRVRYLGWPGILGNTDEMLADPESLEKFAAAVPAMQPLLGAIREMASFAREALGEERLEWLRALPRTLTHDSLTILHASPASCWRAPGPEASDAEFESLYQAYPVVVYGHIHRSFVRRTAGMIVANSGSVGLPYDGDPRASYLLFDDAALTIRRVEYDVDKELRLLEASGLPHWAWTAKMLKTARPQLP